MATNKSREVKGEGSGTDAKFFQFSALKHEPTPHSGCPGRLLNKTFRIENMVVCVISRICQLRKDPVFIAHLYDVNSDIP